MKQNKRISNVVGISKADEKLYVDFYTKSIHKLFLFMLVKSVPDLTYVA